MASGWNLWVWLVSVVVRRYIIDILIIIITFPYSICITVEFVYSGHPSEAAEWLLYTGGLLIEVFNVYVAYGKFHWDFPY